MSFWRCARYVLFVGCLMASGCSSLAPRPGNEEVGQGEIVQIGAVGDRRYQLKGLSVRVSHPVCNVRAYTSGFKNGLVDRWDTNAMLDRVPRQYYLDVPPADMRKFVSSSANAQCVLESFVTGEADGDRVGKKLYGEFLARLRSQ